MWRQRGLQLSEFEGVVDFRVVGALKTPVAELWDDDQPDEESDDPEYGRFAAKLRDAGLTARRERAGHLSRASWPFRCLSGLGVVMVLPLSVVCCSAACFRQGNHARSLVTIVRPQNAPPLVESTVWAMWRQRRQEPKKWIEAGVPYTGLDLRRGAGPSRRNVRGASSSLRRCGLNASVPVRRREGSVRNFVCGAGLATTL